MLLSDRVDVAVRNAGGIRWSLQYIDRGRAEQLPLLLLWLLLLLLLILGGGGEELRELLWAAAAAVPRTPVGLTASRGARHDGFLSRGCRRRPLK